MDPLRKSALIQINFLAGSRIDPSSVAWIDIVLTSPGVATLQVSCLISVLLIEVCQDNSDVPCSIRTAAQTHELTTPSQTSSRRPPTPRPLCRDPTLMLPSDTVRSGRAHPPRPAPPAGFSAARQPDAANLAARTVAADANAMGCLRDDAASAFRHGGRGLLAVCLKNRWFWARQT